MCAGLWYFRAIARLPGAFILEVGVIHRINSVYLFGGVLRQ